MPAISTLTTTARVKARLEITDTTWDTLLDELVKGASDIIEQFCGRHFAQTPYTQQVYSLYQGQRLVFLRAWPVTTLTSAEYRPGTPDVPGWTSLLGSEYELDQDGSLGVLRLYVPLHGTNILRVTYVAGYVINFGDPTHTLPYSVSEICEKMVVKAFKKRTDEGKQSDNASGATVTWFSDDIPPGDQKTLTEFMRKHFA